MNLSTSEQDENCRFSIKLPVDDSENTNNIQQQQHARRSDVIELTPLPRNSIGATRPSVNLGNTTMKMSMTKQSSESQETVIAANDFNEENNNDNDDSEMIDLQTARRSRRLQQRNSARLSQRNSIILTGNDEEEGDQHQQQQEQSQQDSVAPFSAVIASPSSAFPPRKSVTFASTDEVVEFGNSTTKNDDDAESRTSSNMNNNNNKNNKKESCSSTSTSSMLQQDSAATISSENLFADNSAVDDDEDENSENKNKSDGKIHLDNNNNNALFHRFKSTKDLKKASGQDLLDFIRQVFQFEGTSSSSIEIPRIHSSRVSLVLSLLKRHGVDLGKREMLMIELERQQQQQKQKKEEQGQEKSENNKYAPMMTMKSANPSNKSQLELWQDWQRQNCNPLAVLARPKNFDVVQQQLRQNQLKHQNQNQTNVSSSSSSTTTNLVRSGLHHIPVIGASTASSSSRQQHRTGMNHGKFSTASSSSFVQPTMKFGGHHQRTFSDEAAPITSTTSSSCFNAVALPREMGQRRQREEIVGEGNNNASINIPALEEKDCKKTKTAIAFSLSTSGFSGPSTSFSTRKIVPNDNGSKNRLNSQSNNMFIQGAKEIMSKIPKCVVDGSISSLPSSELDFFLSRKLPIGTELPRLKKDKVAACIRICS